MGIVKTEGIVVRQVNTGEADKILTIFSKDLGKITCSAKGARRPRSALVSATQLLCYGEFVLFSGKNMYSINSCAAIEPFYEIRNDIEKLTYASHMAEIINDVILEGQPSGRVLKLFLNSLHMISKTQKNPELIDRIFELRLLSILGYSPDINGCAVCGEASADTYYFNFQKSGFVCGNCRNHAGEYGEKGEIECNSDFVALSKGAVSALNYIIFAKSADLFNFSLSDEVLSELSAVIGRYLDEKLEKRYDGLEFLKTL